jgi:hypothetical protein
MATTSRARDRTALLAFGAAALVSIAAACTLRSLDYLTNGGPVGDAGDAMASGDVASVDAPTTDGGAADADAADGGWCMRNAPAAVLCADFDEGNLTTAFAGGKATFIPGPNVDPGCDGSVGSVASSPPGAFATSVPALGDAGHAVVRYEQPVASPPTQGCRMRMDLKLLTFNPGEEVDLIQLLLYDQDGGAPARAFLSLDPSGSGLVDIDQGGPDMSSSFSFPGDGQWHTYTLDLDLGANESARVYVDDPDELQMPAASATEPAAFAQVSSASFYVGTDVYGPSTPVVAAIDNVVFSTK